MEHELVRYVHLPSDWYRKWKTRKKRTSRDHPNHSIVKIGQNTKKSPGDLRKLVVTQTPMENHLLKLV